MVVASLKAFFLSICLTELSELLATQVRPLCHYSALVHQDQSR